MSLQISAGHGSLLALGMGLADVVTLITLAQRLGNWWSATSGDVNFLDMLDEDENEILRRRGLVDMLRFNKRWGKSVKLLADGRPQILTGPKVEEALGEMSRFTAIMTSIVAVLYEFMEERRVKPVLKLLLIRLVLPSDRGQDLLASQLTNRLNSWRSNARVRGLTTHCQRTRSRLQQQGLLLDGFLPYEERNHVADALHWLLAGDTERYITSSSDIAGLVICLEHLGFDAVGVELPDQAPPERGCRLIYKPSSVVGSTKHNYRAAARLVRPPSTTVSLMNPQESLASFPISSKAGNRCRLAWNAGAQAAKYVTVRVVIPTQAQVQDADDLHYKFLNLGSECKRVNTEIFALADAHGLVLNQELCEGLDEVLSKESNETLNWVKCQTDKTALSVPHMDHYWRTSSIMIEAFTVFQAFCMGYYYTVFLTIVDTSTLEVSTVDGSWGFCQRELLTQMRQYCHKAAKDGLSRQDVIKILTSLLFSHTTYISLSSREQWCLGVVGNRTLLANSLINVCRLPDDIGRFVLLDVDVGGIPTNVQGLIMPGVAEKFTHSMTEKAITEKPREQGPDVDWTRHIEADWDGNPETMLLCFRYKGRRLCSLNPAVADLFFCYAYVEPVESPRCGAIPPVVECDMSEFLQGKTLGTTRALVLVQAYGKPIMRYAALSIYGISYVRNIALSTNCIHTAMERIIDQTSQIVIAGEGDL